MIALEKFLRPTQAELFDILSQKYCGQCTVSGGNFILVHGEAPVMLVAHLDTVHREPVREIWKTADNEFLISPQGIGGDDRCGVYALVNVFELSAKKPWLLFTCDEEIGGVGAEVFCEAYEYGELPAGLNDLKMLIEIDRRGRNDAVYYDCENRAFEAYITSKGFRTAQGSFSDISLVAPALGIAAVNLSSGYYNPHRLNEFIIRSEIDDVIGKVVEIVADAAGDDFPRFEYCDYDYLAPSVPAEYQRIYEALLEEYEEDELEYYREVYGDKILDMLYREMKGWNLGDFEGSDFDDSDK